MKISRKKCKIPKQALILAAHSDDETLGCGGTIKQLSERGYEIMLITMTDGTSARCPDKGMSSGYNRNVQLKGVCNMLGIKYWKSANFPDNRMDSVDLLDVVKFIENSVAEYNFKPNIILTHHPDCLNIDHSIVYKATITAFRPQNSKSQKIYSYYVPSSTDYNPLSNFVGNVYYIITPEQAQIKLDVLKTFYNEEMRLHPHSRSLTNVLNIMKVCGAEVSTTYAEKFQLIRDIVNNC